METENYNCFASYNEFPTVFQLNKGNQLCWPRSWVCQPVLIHSLQASNWDNPLESKKEVILAKNNVTRPVTMSGPGTLGSQLWDSVCWAVLACKTKEFNASFFKNEVNKTFSSQKGA